MATHRLPIITANTSPDSSGDIFQDSLNNQLTLTNAKKQLCYVMQYPTGSDIGFEGKFHVPQNYSSAPKIVAIGVIDGTPANTFGIGFQKLARASSEALDVAYGSEQTASNATWTGYADEDLYEISITLTAGDYSVGDEVFFWFFRDDSVDTTTWNFLLTGLYFEYSDA